MKVECPRCHTHVEMPIDGDPVCPTCGFGAPGGRPLAAAPAAAATATAAPAATAPYGATAPTTGWAPEQGSAQWTPEGQKPQLNQTMAITALVLGIVGCCFMGPLTGIPAAIVGGLAMKKIKDEPTVYGGNGMALAGLILGIIATLAGIIWLVFIAIGFSAIPDECWVDPESPECEEATGGEPAPVRSPAVPIGSIASLPFVLARPRAWHAG